MKGEIENGGGENERGGEGGGGGEGWGSIGWEGHPDIQPKSLTKSVSLVDDKHCSR